MSKLLLYGTLECVMLPGIVMGQAASPAAPPGTTTSEADLVPRITARMRDNVQRLPNYTCTETIERTHSRPDGRIQSEDTVHLEVALIDDEEIFAWPGSTEFQDSGLGELVTSGSFGSGAFGLYTKILFLNERRPELRPQGRVDLDDLDRGAGLIQYDFTVPQSLNEFTLTSGPVSVIVGFEGSIYVDPETLDLRRMDVVLTDIPPQLGLLSATDQVNYDRIQFGQERFLLPVSNRLSMETSLVESLNRVRFEKCRKFQGESVISFGDPALLDDTEQQVIQEVSISSGASVHIVMDSVRKPEEVAVGDLLMGKVSDRFEVDGNELIPKGAKVTSRVVRMDRTPGFYMLGLGDTDIDWKGKHARLNGYVERLPAAEAMRDRTRKMGLATVLASNSQKQRVILIPRRESKSSPISEILTYWRTF